MVRIFDGAGYTHQKSLHKTTTEKRLETVQNGLAKRLSHVTTARPPDG